MSNLLYTKIQVHWYRTSTDNISDQWHNEVQKPLLFCFYEWWMIRGSSTVQIEPRRMVPAFQPPSRSNLRSGVWEPSSQEVSKLELRQGHCILFIVVTILMIHRVLLSLLIVTRSWWKAKPRAIGFYLLVGTTMKRLIKWTWVTQSINCIAHCHWGLKNREKFIILRTICREHRGVLHVFLLVIGSSTCAW